MTTLMELLRKNYQRPVRKCYLKRRYVDNTYEADWVRIDTKEGGLVTKWGQASYSINSDPGNITDFIVTGVSMQFKNTSGFWAKENNNFSYFYDDTTYIRVLSLIKIEAGYYDEDGNEVGVENVFEGFVSSITLNQNETASVKCLSYLSIFTRYHINDLSLSGNMLVSEIYESIHNQAKITKYLPYVAPNPFIDVTINTEELSGNYWEVLKKIAYLSNSIPLLEGSIFKLVPRTESETIAFDFLGRGTSGDDIYGINEYDDEGSERVRLHWIEKDGAIEKKSTNPTYLARYLGEPQEIDLVALVNTDDKNDLLTAQLAQWESPKPILAFETRFLVNLVGLLDKITVTVTGRNVVSNSGLWGEAVWNDGRVWGKQGGSIVIPSNYEWLVTSVSSNLDNWKTKIKCEVIN